MVAPLIGAGLGSVLGGVASGIGSMVSGAMANDANIKLWKMQNEYNTPKAQMARYKEAGLNPKLIYGQGTPGNAGSISVQPLEVPDLGNVIARGVQADQGQAQQKLIGAQEEVQREQLTGMRLENSMRRLDLAAQVSRQMKDLKVARNDSWLMKTWATIINSELGQAVKHQYWSSDKEKAEMAIEKMRQDMKAQEIYKKSNPWGGSWAR